jgi:hypothetical protein
LADGAELFFDVRIEFGDQSIAVRADVCGIDGVGIVIKRIGVLRHDDQHAGKAAGGPILIQLVGIIDAASSSSAPPSSAAFARRQRLFAKCVERRREVALRIHYRIMRVGMLVKSVGQENDRAQIHRPAPELTQQLALNPDVLYEFCVGDGLDRRNGLGQLDAHCRAGG